MATVESDTMEQTPSTTPQPTEQLPENPQPPHAASVPQTTTTNSSANPNPTSVTAPTSRPSITSQLQTRPPFNTRPWQQPPQPHFSLPSPPFPSSPAPTPSASITPRGGMAIGVPAHHPSPVHPPPASFSSLTPPSYGTQQSQIRQPMQGIGMTGTLGTSSMRPGGASASQLRPSQSSLRPQSLPISQSPASQNFQGHGMLRVPTLGPPNSSQNQPWLSSGTQGKPPLPTPVHQPQTSPQSFQQRSHLPQQHHHSLPTTTQPAINSSQLSSQSSASASASAQPHDHYGQQFPPPRIQQPLSHQQQVTRGQGLGIQRPPLGMPQSGALHTAVPNKTVTTDNEESSDRIVTKRSIQDLLNQIDPSEKFEPEVEDILVDIAEEFVESITTFGCSLAKHRKSSTLEAKDILLHLERNWNLTLPGYGGDEIKIYKKPVFSDIHRERIAAIRRSTATSDPTMATKNLGGPSGGNTKTQLAKGPAASTEAA